MTTLREKRKQAPAPQREIKKFLVVRVGALGDTVMATPLLRALKRRDSGCQIDFLAWRPAAPLLEHNPNVNRILTLKMRNWPLAVSPEKRNLVSRIQARGYDSAVLLESAPRYRQILDRAKLTRILSFDETPFDPQLHSSANHLRVAGFEDWDDSRLGTEVHLTDEERERGARMLQDLPRPWIGLHAGYGPTRRKQQDQGERLKGWPAKNFVELGSLLLENGANLVVTGSAADHPTALEISRSWPSGRFRVVAGQTSVRELAAVLSRLRLLISVDSGPAHIAAAVGTPLIVLWGPAKLQQVRPIAGRGPVEILRHPVPCAPCWDTPLMKTCPVNICMRGITPEEVFETARRFL